MMQAVQNTQTLTFTEIGVIVAIFVAVGGWLERRFAEQTRFAKLELKVDTMWTFQLRRGGSEAVNNGLAELNSPLKFNPDALKIFETLAPDLKKFYDERGYKYNASDLLLEIEREFGARILKEVCIPYQLHNGSCLLIASAVARGTDVAEAVVGNARYELTHA